MTAQTVATLLEGSTSLLGGLYATLLGFRVVGRSRAYEELQRRYGRVLKICGPGMMVFGLLFLLRPAFSADSSAPSALDAMEESNLVPLAIGTRWSYKAPRGQLELRIAAHEKMGDLMSARIETSMGGQVAAIEHQTMAAGRLYQTGSNGLIMDPPMCLLRAPGSGAQEWEYASGNGAARCRFKMTPNSSVEVPAGTYDNAFLVEMEATDPRGTTYRSTWYVPGVGAVKYLVRVGSEQQAVELEKFEGAR